MLAVAQPGSGPSTS